MDTEQEQAPEAEQTDDNGAPAQTVRVPNVSPGAMSGLDHQVIGSNALAPQEDDGDEDAEPEAEEPDTDPMPDADVDAKLAWVREAEDSDTATARADKVWTFGTDPEPSEEYKATLAARLRAAVHGEPDPGAGGEADGGSDDQSDLQVAPDSQVPGEVVVSQTAGTGDAVNAETGEVTKGGEPLPEVPDQGDGTPLEPADAGAEDGGGTPDSKPEGDGTPANDQTDSTSS